MYLLILGIDGLDYNLLKQNLGQMPFFKSLMQKSAWGMMTPDIALSPQSWSTIFTGLGEGRHGIVNFYTPLSKLGKPKLWNVLENHGLKVGVINVPMTFPPEKLKRGFMVSGQPRPFVESWPKDLCSTFPPIGPGEVNAKTRHDWAMAMSRELASDVDCLIAATIWADETGHGASRRWSRRKLFIMDTVYAGLDVDLQELYARLKPEYLAIFSDHGWNCATESSTLFNPWTPGAQDNHHRHVKREDWADHTKEAVVLFKGPDVKPGKIAITNRDFMPTLLQVLNINSGITFDGKAHDLYQMPEEDKQVIDKRLEALGYIE